MEKEYQFYTDLYSFTFFHLFFRSFIVLQKSYIKNCMNHWPNPKSTEISGPINGNHRIWTEALVLAI